MGKILVGGTSLHEQHQQLPLSDRVRYAAGDDAAEFHAFNVFGQPFEVLGIVVLPGLNDDFLDPASQYQAAVRQEPGVASA